MQLMNILLPKNYCMKKVAHEVLVKLNPKVDFTNILHTVFTCADPKGTKKTDSLTVLIALLRSALIKSARKMLVKLTLSAEQRTCF